MRPLKIAFVALLLALPSVAQEKQLHGIDPSDMDRKVNPCDNFFDYANGTWRANNPIPPSMVRWSKRWQSGETTKETLRTILEEASAKKNPQASTEQLIGDYYGSCMDEKKINDAGLKPLSSELKMIDSIKATADLQRAITALKREGISAPFSFGSAQNPHNPTQVIADTGAGGLGLPDRDFYFKEDAKSKETREQYLAHIAAVFRLAGSDQAASDRAAQTVMKLETALAGASLAKVEVRHPFATQHAVKNAEAQKNFPG